MEASALEKPIVSVSVGNYDLSIRAIVPIIRDSKFIGLVEISSRFNSISQQMKDFGVESVVVLNKEYKNSIKIPFSKTFVDDYYIANIDAPIVFTSYLRRNGIYNYIHLPYKSENGYIISIHPLKNIQNRIIGHYIMFKKQDDVLNINLDFLCINGLV